MHLREFTSNVLIDFITHNAYPNLLNYNEEVGEMIFTKNIPAMFLYRNSSNIDQVALESVFDNLVSVFDYKLKIVFSDISTEAEKKVANSFNISITELPTIRIIDTRYDLFKHYKLYEEINEANILNLFKRWIMKDLRQEVKSEEIPDYNKLLNKTNPEQNLNITKLVALNFYSMLFNNTSLDNKDTIVLFHTPDHEFELELLEEFHKIASRYAKRQNNPLIFFHIDTKINIIDELDDVRDETKIIIWPKKEKTQWNWKEWNKEHKLTQQGFIQWVKNITDYDLEDEEENKIEL